MATGAELEGGAKCCATVRMVSGFHTWSNVKMGAPFGSRPLLFSPLQIRKPAADQSSNERAFGFFSFLGFLASSVLPSSDINRVFNSGSLNYSKEPVKQGNINVAKKIFSEYNVISSSPR